MTEANDMRKNDMLELNKLDNCDTEETIEEQQNISYHEEAASADIPLSLLNYFKTSKSRAAVCEQLIFEDLEDFSPLGFPTEFSEDKELKQQIKVSFELENEEKYTVDDRLSTPKDEDEAGPEISEFMETGCDLALKLSEYKAERDREEMQREEQRKQREMDFQEELKRIMEAEKLQQMEFELMEKRAQEKLEHELLLQQELIGNLQKQVEQERKKIEEEQERKKEEEKMKAREEEDKKKRKEMDERKKREEERKKKEMEEKKKREEDDVRKRKEMEEKRKRQEEERERKEMEEKRKRQEEERERKEMEEKRKRQEGEERERKEMEEKRRMKEEERERKEMEKKRRMKEEEERERKEMEEKRRKEEEEERKIKAKEEEDKKKKKEMEEKMKREEEEERKRKEMEKRRMEGEEERKLQEGRKRMEVKKVHEERKFVELSFKKECRGKKEEEKGNMKETQTNMTELDGKSTGEEKTEEEIKLTDELMETKEDEMRKEDKRQKVQVKMKKKSREEIEEEEVRRMKMDDRKNRRNEDETQQSEKEGKRKKCEDKRPMMENKEMNKEKEIEEEYRSTEAEKLRLRQEMEQNESNDESDNKDKRQEEVRKRLQENIEKTVISEHPKKRHSAAYEASPTSTPSSMMKTLDHTDPDVTPSPLCLPEHTEQKRLSWMRDCMSWSNLSLHNRRRQTGPVKNWRALRRTAETISPPPLSPETLLQATGCQSLQEVTTVTLGDLPGCNLSTLAQCSRLQSVTLRRCGLKSMEGISQLQELCYIDLQENDISFMDCENMKSLRVLRLSHNKLTSIHGLNGADNLDVLELSHNSITRVAGLESMKRLQRLSLDHNQLISTKGLRDVYTLLQLDCSHNHLGSVEGLENNALLHTVNLTANSLMEPPSLNNQVLLRELHLDDNCIGSLQALSGCWLPLLHSLTLSQNRLIQLPSISDFVSLENLDLRFNCLSELQNVCENLKGCQFLRDVHLMGNPLQKESGWRATLQKALPGLRTIDSQQTDSFLLPPAVQQVSLASGCFLTFCQAQIQQTRDLQQRHSGELSSAASPLDAVKSFCLHLTLSLKLAEEQRFAQEYGDTTVSDGHKAAGQSTLQKDVDTLMDEKLTYYPGMESSNKTSAVRSSRHNVRCRNQSLEGTSAAEMEPTPERKTTPFSFEKAPQVSSCVLQLNSKAAVMIQQQWRKYKQKCGNTKAPSIAEKGGERGGDGSEPGSGSSYINRSVAGQDSAATVIQAVWRGFALRRRLASALAAVTQPDTEEDDTFEEVDMDEFFFDEAALEKHWTLTLPEDTTPRYYPVSQPLSLKPPGACQDPTQHILSAPHVWSPKQAWVAGQQGASATQRIPIERRSKSPTSPSVRSGLSERSEKFMEEWGFSDSHTAMLMLKRARKMKSSKHQEKKLRDPAVRLASFRSCSYQLGPVEAPNRPSPHHRKYVTGGEAALGLRQAEKTEQMKVKQWLRTQSAQSERPSESERFLPEISSSVLNGGRVQLVPDPANTDRLHQASGLLANSSFVVQPCKPTSYPRSNSLSHARINALFPKRVASAPSKKERISFRDNPVKLSGGWGGGKKRDRLHK